jgi:uncharacterized protein (TIGR02147 family)
MFEYAPYAESTRGLLLGARGSHRLNAMGAWAVVDVFHFRDYRVFLRAHYELRKQRRGGYSLRAFSRGAGLRSPNYLKLVMDGDRNLTPSMALRFAEGCGLSGEGAEYFCELVAFNQARLARERELHFERLTRFSRFRKVHKLDLAQSAYHAHWYIPAVRELLARTDFCEDAVWIGRTLLPEIAPAQAKQAIAVLLELGLAVRDDAGRLRQAEELVETPSGPLSHHVVGFHRAMMTLASESLERIPREEREIASLTLCLSDAQLQQLKNELESFRNHVLQKYQTTSDGVRVVQLNVQMFPLSRAKAEAS